MVIRKNGRTFVDYLFGTYWFVYPPWYRTKTNSSLSDVRSMIGILWILVLYSFAYFCYFTSFTIYSIHTLSPCSLSSLTGQNSVLSKVTWLSDIISLVEGENDKTKRRRRISYYIVRITISLSMVFNYKP